MSDSPGVVRGGVGIKGEGQGKLTVVFDGSLTPAQWAEFTEALKALVCKYSKLKFYEFDGIVAPRPCSQAAGKKKRK